MVVVSSAVSAGAPLLSACYSQIDLGAAPKAANAQTYSVVTSELEVGMNRCAIASPSMMQTESPGFSGLPPRLSEIGVPAGSTPSQTPLWLLSLSGSFGHGSQALP